MNKHAQTVQFIYNAFNRGDIPAILDLIADDVAWESWKDNSAQNSGVPWMLARKGKAGALDYFKAVSELKISNFTVLSIMGNEHQVAAEFFKRLNTVIGNHCKVNKPFFAPLLLSAFA